MKTEETAVSGQRNTQHLEIRPLGRDRLIRLPEVIFRVGLSRATIYNRINEGTFPAGVALGPRSVAWLESSIDEWIAERVKSSHIEEVH